MEDIDLNIPDLISQDDFTIVYKGKVADNNENEEGIEEIKTSKEELLRKLRYFKNKANEINQTSEIYIHDVYSITIFKNFIDSIKTKTVKINENNYSYYYNLSTKYEYYELKKQIESFSEKRPDISNLINNFKFDEIDYSKEEFISSHLDICLQNELLVNFPIPILIRILNSPKRKLNNHHLLLSFIQKVVKNYISSKTNEDDETKNQNIQLLYGSFDYLKMSNEDLHELFNDEHFSNIFNNRGTIEIMRTFPEERKASEQKIVILEKTIEKQEQKHAAEINSLMKMQQELFDKINELNLKFEEQNHLIQKYKEDNEELNELLQKKNQEQEQKMAEYESKIKEFEKLMERKLDASIDIKVLPNSQISGKISIKEKGVTLDKTKSKYILNNSSSNNLGLDCYNEGYLIESLDQKISFVKQSGTFYLHAILFDNFGNFKEVVSSPVTVIKVDPITFDYTGKVQAVTLEPGRYKLEVWGAEGGKTNQFSEKSGKGGYSVGTLKLTETVCLRW